MSLLKWLFWLYFLLLIFEGALRKWVLPQLSGPLLVVRDPVSMLIIWEAYRTHKWPKEWTAATAFLAVGLLGLCSIQFMTGNTSWFIVLYGLRSYLLPFPVALIMGENLTASDLRKFAVCTLWLLLPLTALEVAQYYAPAGSFLNKGAYRGTEQLAYALGHVRASSTFSYVTGPTNFLPLAAAFIFYGLTSETFARRWLLWAAMVALIIAIPVTGSRSLVFLLAGVVASVVIASMGGGIKFGRSVQAILAIAVVVLLISQFPAFNEATNTLADRFSNATQAEGGSTGQSLFLRSVQPTIRTLEISFATNNWIGTGVGYGASAVSTLLTGGQYSLAGEEEVPRVINEFGAPCGIAFMLFRLALGIMITFKATSYMRIAQPLAWFLLPLTFNALWFCTLEQPTFQGFLVISVGFSLAALNTAVIVLPPSPEIFVNPRIQSLRKAALARAQDEDSRTA